MFPLIGVTSSSKLFSEYSYDAVNKLYTKAVEDSGGIPLVLPSIWNNKLRECVFSLLDGLLLTGGPDVDPALYNEEPVLPYQELGLDRPRDDFEISITKSALKKKIPVLAICRGMQMLAAASAGRLRQEISQETVAHRQGIRIYQNGGFPPNTHTVYLCSGSRLMDILNTKIISVISRHHQAVEEVPKEFVLSAYSEDGTIEAMERIEEGHFCIGVQFHPEEMPEDQAQQNLFRAFVAAAAEYRAKHRPGNIKKEAYA